MTLPKKLEVARIRVSFQEPFFGSIMYGIPCVLFGPEMEEQMKASGMTPTMATDGKKLLFSEDWVNQRTVNELVGVLIHEIWHIVLKHHLRCDRLMSARNLKDGNLSRMATHQRWNKAADYVINPMVLEDGKTLPNGGLVERRYRGHSTEQVYDMLNEERKKQGGKGKGKGGGDGEGQGKGGSGEGGDEGEGQDWGQVISPGDLSEDEIRELEQEIETSVRQAAMTAKARGKVPAAVDRLIKDWDDAKVDWRARLWRACDSNGGVHQDDSWERPNRRYIQHGMFLPTTVEWGPGTVAIAVDSSGSVSEKEFKMFMGEIESIVNDCKPNQTIFMECDADIPKGQPIMLDADEDFPSEYTRHHGGGTSFKPPFKWLKKHNIRPQWMVYLTDGYAPFPDDPGYPVIWVITSDVQPPFGTTIHLKD